MKASSPQQPQQPQGHQGHTFQVCVDAVLGQTTGSNLLCLAFFFPYTIINLKKKIKETLWPIAARAISRSYCQVAVCCALTETLTGACTPSSLRETEESTGS